MKTEFQKCMDGEIFDGKDKELAEMTLKTKRLLVKLNSTDYADTKQKEAILQFMLIMTLLPTNIFFPYSQRKSMSTWTFSPKCPNISRKMASFCFVSK